MRKFLAAALAAVLAAGPAAAADDFWSGAKAKIGGGQSSTTGSNRDAYEAAERAASEAWERLPFSTRRAMFVTRKAALYGDYDARGSNVFAPGEPLVSYVEPLGFAYRKSGDLYTFEGTIDFAIRTKSGEELGSQKAFQSYSLTSHARAREFFLNLTITLDGAPAGDYVLAVTLNDTVRKMSTEIEQPFTIRAADGRAP
ncbi:hypothetical protein U8607_16805 [Methylobacterium durans]|uniref:hypothetical protein n=1 Tax=Methylobacterium durans TaxID=2202825 RepID=UPI002AFE672B|nr:hypothetical protein [Methylobacterium durans]MEA1833746.1 hypothetical protein [Methylobacterium durans]